MTFGLNIIGSHGRLQIDENYSHLKPTTTSPGTYTVFPPSGYVTGDLIIARMPVGVNGYIAHQPQQFNPTTYLYYNLRKMAGNEPIPNSGMGLNVINASNQLIFSSDGSFKRFNIVAFGSQHYPNDSNVYAGIHDTPGFRFPATGNLPDLDKYWVVSVNTLWDYASDHMYTISWMAGYSYNWSSGTSGYIRVHTYFELSNSFVTAGPPFQYVIMKEIN